VKLTLAHPLWRDKQGNLDRGGLLLLLILTLAAIGAIWRGVPWNFILYGVVILVFAIQWLRASPGDQERRDASLFILIWLSMGLSQIPFLPQIVRFGLIFVGIALLVWQITSARKSARQFWVAPKPEVGVVSGKLAARAAVPSLEGLSRAQTGFRGAAGRAPGGKTGWVPTTEGVQAPKWECQLIDNGATNQLTLSSRKVI
jgi:hypothetical protein